MRLWIDSEFDEIMVCQRDFDKSYFGSDFVKLAVHLNIHLVVHRF